jgi:hypothetical protein
MSTTTIDPQIGLKFVIAGHLIPFFQSGPVDTNLARQMAHSAVDAYNPQSRADYINIARTIAFSVAAVALLAQITAEPMALPDQMKAYARANALNRSADQSERTMLRRRRDQQANPTARQKPSEPQAPTAQPGDDAEIEAHIAEALKQFRAATTPPATDRPASRPAATSHPTPSHSPAAKFRESLLRHSAIPGLIGQHPAGQRA